MTIKYPPSYFLTEALNTGNKMNMTDKIIAYEADSMNDDEVIPFFQELIDTGMAWRLQGHYGRMAKRMIKAGLCTLNKKNKIFI